MSKVELIQIVAILLGVFWSIVNAIETRLIKRFVRRGANSSESAIELPNQKFVVRRQLARFQRAGVIVVTDQGKYYIDQDLYKKFRKKRCVIFVSAVLMILSIAMVAMILMNK